jgi:hypothetical protein
MTAVYLICTLALGAIGILQTLKLRAVIRIGRAAIAERDAKIRELGIRVVTLRGELNQANGQLFRHRLGR